MCRASVAATVVALSVTFCATPVLASCYGTSAFRTCNDNAGNSYNIQRFGNSTYMQGSNAGTGSSWSQQTYRSGNMSNTYGNDADGNSWNSTTIRTPGMVQQFGTDSNGNSFNRICTAAGCF